MGDSDRLVNYLDPAVRIERTLGRGGDGTVYLARSRDDHSLYVLKVFTHPVPFDQADGLILYASSVGANEFGLAHITLIEDRSHILALKYRHSPLRPVHYLCFAAWDHVAQCLFGAYCRMQHYLISRHEIALTDTDVRQFLLAPDGRFHYIDYSGDIESIHHPWSLERGQFGYALCLLLASTYHRHLKVLIRPTPGYSYTRPCSYSMHGELTALAERHAWVAKVVREVRNNNASALLDADFYLRLCEGMPERVRFPSVVNATSRLLFRLGHVRAGLTRLRGSTKQINAKDQPQ